MAPNVIVVESIELPKPIPSDPLYVGQMITREAIKIFRESDAVHERNVVVDEWAASLDWGC